MTSAMSAPEGYRFCTGDYQGPLFDDPANYGITNLEGPEASRVVVLHEVCGCPVLLGMLAAHEAWHATLEA